MQKLKKFLLLCITITLTGCGFHLRGTVDLPPELHTLCLKSSSPYTPFMHQLDRTLKNSGVHLVDSPKDAPLTLLITDENLTTQATSVGSSQQMRDYIATYSVTYNIQNAKGQIIFGPKTLNEQQTITIVTNELITNSNKLDNAKNIMYQRVISRITFQLTSNEIAQALKKARSSSPPATTSQKNDHENTQ